MLGRSEQGGPLIATKIQPADQVAPTDYSYSAQSPLAERIHSWEKLLKGFGLGQQASFQDQRYRKAIRVDHSVYPSVKGPDISTLTPATTDSTNGASHFFELNSELYALVGRYCLKRASDASWTVSKDFEDYGAGTKALDVETFYSTALSGNYAWVALSPSTENFAYFDGTTWTQATGAAMDALAFKRVGREFWRARDTNLLTKVDSAADPTNVNNWAAANAFRVGDKSSAIVRLAVTAVGTLIVFKTDGIYTLDAAGDDKQLYHGLRFAADDENGRYPFEFENSLHNTYREGHFRLGPDLSYEAIGPEKGQSDASGLTGRITAGIGHSTFGAYAGLYDPDSGHSYLLKFGAWDGEARAEDWHGSLSQEFTSKKITAMGRSSEGAVSGHQRCYIGFSDGSLAWFTLPCTPHPAACASYTFTTSDGEDYLPLWHGLFLADPKTLRRATVTGPNLSSTNYLQLEYKTDPAAGAYTSFGTNFDAIRETAEFPNNTSATIVDLKWIWKSTTNTSSPQVTGRALHHAVRPALVLKYAGVALATDGLVKRDGRPFRIGADAIRDAVKAAAEAQGSVTVILPDETSKQLSFIGYGESLAWDERLRQWRAGISFEAVEFKTNTVYGLVGRLAPYTVGDLAGFTVGDLGGI